MTETLEIDLKEIGKTLLKRAWLIVLCAVVLGAVFLVYTVNFVQPQYQSRLSFYVSNTTSASDSGGVASTDLAVALRLVNSYIEILEEDVVLDKVAAELNHQVSAAQLRGMISAVVKDDTEIFTVTVTSTNPQLSADVANTLAAVAPGVISEVTSGGSAKAIGTAKVPTARSSPDYITNTMLGAVVGAVLAAVVVVVAMFLDVRIKSEDALERITGARVLGFIPDFAEAARPVTKKKGRR